MLDAGWREASAAVARRHESSHGSFAVKQLPIVRNRQVPADVRTRGYGAWRFDDPYASLHDRIAGILTSLEPTATVAPQLTNLMTMIAVRRTLEKDLSATE
jgi:hypothetical protein